MATGVQININSTDRTALIPFSDGPDGVKSWITVTETVPGSATMSCRLFDLTNTVTVNRLDPIVVADLTNTKNIFQGYVQKRKLDVVATYRVWELTCVDLNAITDTTLVGTPDGTHWVQDPPNTYTAIDPNAFVNGGSDAANVQRIIAAYWKYPVALDTTTYVEVTNPSVGYPDGTTWDRRTLREVLDDIAALAGPYTVWWIDADAYLHWTNKPQQGQPSGGTNNTGGTGTYNYTTGNLLMLFPQQSYTINSASVPGAPTGLTATAGDTLVALSWNPAPSLPPVPPAPYNVSDSADNITSLPYENFSLDYDDSGAAMSLYANGATGYTYDSGVPAFPDGITPTCSGGQPSTLPTESGVSGYAYYIATLTQPVLVYAVSQTTGCIEQPGTTYGYAGQQLYVNPTFVQHCTSGGGNFWEIKNNPSGTGVFPNGWRISQGDTSVIITPVQSPTQPPPTTSGTQGTGPATGGSGWVNGAAASWLSRYIDLPDAISQTDRDTKGTVALQYMSQSIIRGACDVLYPGILYRAGMGILVTNVPAGLSASLQMIQRCTTTFISGDDKRRARLEWGTAPLGHLGLRRQAAKKPPVKPGATQHDVTAKNTVPMPGSTITLYTQLKNAQGEPWAIQGKVITWSVQVFDGTGCDVTTTSAYDATNNPGGWQLLQNQTISDTHGASSTQLQLATNTGYQYFATATSPD